MSILNSASNFHVLHNHHQLYLEKEVREIMV